MNSGSHRFHFKKVLLSYRIHWNLSNRAGSDAIDDIVGSVAADFGLSTPMPDICIKTTSAGLHYTIILNRCLMRGWIQDM